MSPSGIQGDSTPVIITSVTAEHFGRWHRAGLDLNDPTAGSEAPDQSGMVVVHGPNQAGKSTFATLMQWLLAGPGELRHGDVAHLGEPGQTLSGSMEGRIGTSPFSISGSFRVPAKGSIKPLLTVTEGVGVDAGQYDLESWVTRLRGIDAEIVDSVYFIWGADLHDISDIDTQLEGMSMGHLRGGNPREVIESLDRLAKQRSTARGESAVSVTTFQRRIKEVDVELETALANLDDYITASAELKSARDRADEAKATRMTRTHELTAIDAAIEALSVEDRIRHIRIELDAIPLASENWLQVVAERRLLSDLDERLTTAQQNAQITEHEAWTAAATLGMTPDELVRIRISDSDANLTTELVTEWRSAVGARDAARALLNEAASELTTAEALRDRAIEASSDLDVTLIGRAHLGPDEHQQIMGRLMTAENADASAVEAAARVRSAELDHNDAVNRHDQALSSWHEHHGAIDPSQWIAGMINGSRSQGTNPRTSDAAPPPVRSWRQWVGTIALAVTAVVAAGMGQWTLAVLTTVASAVTAVIQLSRVRPQPDTATVSSLVRDADTLAFNAASAVVDARRVIDYRASTLITAEQHAQLAAEQTARATRAMRDMAESFGVHLRAPLVEVRGELDRWLRAVNADTNVQDCWHTHESAFVTVQESTRAVDALVEQITTHLVSLGLPTPDQPGEAPDIVAAYRDVTAAISNHAAAIAPLQDLEERWQELIAPVDGATEGWSRQRLLDELARMERDASERAELETSLTHERSRLDTYRSDPRVAAILDAGPSLVDIGLQRERVSQQHAEAEAAEVTEREQVGIMSEKLEQLGSRTAAAELRRRKGGLAEEQQDLALEAAAAALASQILGSVADDYQRRNQPELIKNTSALATRVTSDWRSLRIGAVGPEGKFGLLVEQPDGGPIPVAKLSTGAKGLLQLALRLALARSHLDRLGLAMPLICDDPFVHFSDDWARSGMALLADEARHRQVIMFTCHRRSAETAQDLGAHVIQLGDFDEGRN